MHGSWGNMIEAEDAFERMGADVMRWQFCAQPPDREPALRLRAGARDQAPAAHALELGPLPRRLREHRGLRGRRYADLDARARRRAAPARPLARRADARSSSPRRRAALRGHAHVDRSSTRSRPSSTTCRTGTSAARGGASTSCDEAAFSNALVRARAGAARDRAGDAVPRRAPVAEPRRGRVRRTRPDSVFLAGWPEPRPRPTRRCSREVAEVRRVVELGRRARARRPSLKLRQPLRRLVVQGAAARASARGRDRATSCA